VVIWGSRSRVIEFRAEDQASESVVDHAGRRVSPPSSRRFFFDHEQRSRFRRSGPRRGGGHRWALCNSFEYPVKEVSVV